MNEFTGERVIPGEVEVDLWNEHLARYAFASRFASARRVLDVGCGSGYGAVELSRTARSVTGLDISLDALQFAGAHYTGESLSFIAASASSLPFKSNAFDLVTAYEVIEHLDDWAELIREARRVLAIDGLFSVSTPNKQYYAESRGAAGENPFHVHEFTAAEFERELRAVFPCVTFLLQNRSEAFVFYQDAVLTPVEARLDRTAGSADDAHFFVALCSNEPQAVIPAFIHVPQAANILRDREQHIRKLEGELALNQQWLDETRAERAQSLLALEAQKAHLEEQNRWALDLEGRWKAAEARIAELQDTLARQQQAAQTAITGLESENQRKTEWARGLSREIEQYQHELQETQATVEERTRWALDLQAKLDSAEARLAGVQASRWMRAGRVFGIGPEL